MAHSNMTDNYELSQFLATDKPAWLTDYNTDMEKIDEAMADIQEQVTENKADFDAAETEMDRRVSICEVALTVCDDRETALEGRMNSAETRLDVDEANIVSGTNRIGVLEGKVQNLENGQGLAPNSITTAMLQDECVTTDKIARNSVTTDEILNKTIQYEDLSDDCIAHFLPVTTDKIANGAVTEAKIASNAVTTSKIKDSNVTTAKLADSAVNTAKIAGGAVTNAKLGANSVTTDKIQNGTIKYEDLSDECKNSFDPTQSTTALTNVVKALYPVGSIYLSMGVNPNNIFTGTTWTRVSGGVLYTGNGTNDGDSVGNDNVTLGSSNIPRHRHSVTPTGSVSISGSASASTSGTTWNDKPRILLETTGSAGSQRYYTDLINEGTAGGSSLVPCLSNGSDSGIIADGRDLEGGSWNHSHGVDISGLTGSLSLDTVNTDYQYQENPSSFSVKQAGINVSVWKRTA